MGRFITADPTIQHPYDPQDFSRYAYARNNPVKYIDPTGYGFWDWLKSFFAGLIGAFIGAVLTAVGVPAPISFAVGGAISGAIFGAIDGGLSGALKGAAWGAGMGFAFGSLGMLDPTGTLQGLAIIGGGIYTGITGGGEGLANYAAGVLGAATGNIAGSVAGNTLVGQPTVRSSQPNSKTNSLQQEPAVREALAKSQFEIVDDYIQEKLGVPSAFAGHLRAEIIAQAAQVGQVGPGGFYDVDGVFKITIGPNEPVVLGQLESLAGYYKNIRFKLIVDEARIIFKAGKAGGEYITEEDSGPIDMIKLIGGLIGLADLPKYKEYTDIVDFELNKTNYLMENR